MAPRFDQYFTAISTGDYFQAEIIALSVQHDSKSALINQETRTWNPLILHQIYNF